MRRNVFMVILVFFVSLFWFMFPAELGKRYYKKAFETMRSEKDPALAQKLLKKAIGFNPNYKPIQVALSISYADEGLQSLESKNYSRAIELLKKAIATCPFYTTHYVSLGNIYARIENYDRSLVAYKMALEMNDVLDSMDLRQYKGWKSYMKVDSTLVLKKIDEMEKTM